MVGEQMLSLVPTWAYSYSEFWNTIRRRNVWLIKLRYGAILMLFLFLASAEFILGLSFTRTQITALIIVNISILIYNIFLQWVRKFLKCDPGKFNPLHFSLVQMILDLTVLGLIVYFTGGIETPLFMLFVFHMIIGSLILPEKVIYSIAGLVIAFFNVLVFGEYLGVIPHQKISGLLSFPLYNSIKFIISYDVVFTFVIVVSVFIANNIAKQLYSMEQQLVESLDKLNAAEEEKQKYIIGIVHEIKTPLAALHSYLDLVLKKYLGPLSEGVEERLKRALSRSQEAIEMINNVLKVSKLRLLDEISMDVVEIYNVLVEIVKKQAVSLKAKHIMLNLIDLRTERRPIKGDQFLLDIAFSNLIGNAVKYVGNNGLIEVKLTEQENKLSVEVCDNGIGIPAHEMDKIFMDFFRASNIRQKSYEGTGLGLSIVKQIIEKHGGTISVKSPSRLAIKNKPGASFLITLPVIER